MTLGGCCSFVGDVLTGFPAYAIVWGTLVYVGAATSMEIWAPQCLFIEDDEYDADCLQHGVDNSTSTILTGLLSSAFMFGLAIQLWSVKCCYAPRLRVTFQDDHHKGHIRPSGIWAQLYMGGALLLQSIARIMQPNAAIGQKLYWGMTATSFLLMGMAMYSHAYFCMRSIGKRLQILCCNCCCFSSRVGFTTGLIVLTSLLMFSAGVASLVLKPDTMDAYDDGDGNITSDTNNNATVSVSVELLVAAAAAASADNNIFDMRAAAAAAAAEDDGGSGRRYLQQEVFALTTNTTTTSAYTNSTTFRGGDFEISVFEWEHVCQEIVYYGGFAFAFASFFFWVMASKVLQKAITARQRKASSVWEDDLWVGGCPTTTAVALVPWVAFAVGPLYPVWAWLVADFSNQYWLQVFQVSRSGIVYHYGMSLIALLAHNWTSTLTYPIEDETVFTEDVFNDLTMGAFLPSIISQQYQQQEQPPDDESSSSATRMNAEERKQRREEAFADLTLGACLSSKANNNIMYDSDSDLEM